MKILIVGSGLTGSLTASLLSKARPSLSLTVWDKARGAGGRMCIHRCPTEPDVQVDMGTQYISKFMPKASDTVAYNMLKNDTFTELLKSCVLQPLYGTIEGARDDIESGITAHYVAPKGMNSVVRHFLFQSRASVVYQHQLRAIDVRDNDVYCETVCGRGDNFDAVIVTMPVPQILALQGSVLENLETCTWKNLEAVTYSSRYALGLFYKGLSPPFEWTMKYCEHPIVRFVSWDMFKRGLTDMEKNVKTLLVHTSVPFAVKHLESDKSCVEELIIAALTEVLPNLPQPQHTHLIRWRFSQVQEPYINCPGFVELCKRPLVLAAGDGFVGSNFENCLYSAHTTTQTLLNYFDSTQCMP